MFPQDEVIFNDADIMKKSNIKKIWGGDAQELQRHRKQLLLQALQFLFAVFRREQLPALQHPRE